MFFAHLPAGYMITRAWNRAFDNRIESPALLMGLGLLASILPDFDLIYAFLIDHGRLHHHRYLTHWPFFWLAMLGCWALLMRNGRLPPRWHELAVVSLNVAMHLCLDWIVSVMFLLAPFSNQRFNLIDVPARYQPWYLNFFLYWTIWLEVGITAVGAYLFFRDRPWRKVEIWQR